MKMDKGQYIMIKGSIQEEGITIRNICAPNIGAPQYVRQMLTSMKGKMNSNTIIVGDFIQHSHLWIDQLKRKEKKNSNSQSNLEKEEWNWGNQPA